LNFNNIISEKLTAMKKLILIILPILPWCISYAQYLPLMPIEELSYNHSIERNGQILIQDSMLYEIRSGGLQELNINSGKNDFHWANLYDLKNIVKDTGKNYIYLKNRNFIGRYNAITERYENIWSPTYGNRLVNDIDVSPDGKVWAVTSGTSKEIAIFDGVSWQLFPFTGVGSGFKHVKMVNDTLAFVMANIFYSFHNGLLDTLFPYPGIANFEDWDVDQDGNMWIAARYQLVHFFEGIETVYDTSNTPMGNDKFIHVKIGSDGHVWTSGDMSRLYEYDGTAWQILNLPDDYYRIENFTLDAENELYVVTESVSSSKVFISDGGSWSSIAFTFMPISNLKALGALTFYPPYAYYATNEGLFYVNLLNYSLADFFDTTTLVFSDDITCFTYNDPNYQPSFGSHHGVQSLDGFNNTFLPNDTINNMCYDNGTYYIGTDSGLVAYNGILYDFINTSNAPLPSDKITFIITGETNNGDYSNTLYIGTDKGLAIYQNAQWRVYDTTNVPVNHFYVTGVRPPSWDSATYISTIGSGLIKVYPHGGYELYNTANGQLLDDTLYYVMNVDLAECGYYIISGTSHHGLLYTDYNLPFYFYYDTNDVVPIRSSKMAVYSDRASVYLVSTDSLLHAMSPCGMVNESHSMDRLKWYRQDNQLIITVPDDISGKYAVTLTDILGKMVISKNGNSTEQKIILNVSHLPSGVYFVRLYSTGVSHFAKVLLVHN